MIIYYTNDLIVYSADTYEENHQNLTLFKRAKRQFLPHY